VNAVCGLLVLRGMPLHQARFLVAPRNLDDGTPRGVPRWRTGKGCPPSARALAVFCFVLWDVIAEKGLPSQLARGKTVPWATTWSSGHGRMGRWKVEGVGRWLQIDAWADQQEIEARAADWPSAGDHERLQREFRMTLRLRGSSRAKITGRDSMLKYLASALLCSVLAAPALAQGASIKKMDPGLDTVIAPGTKIEKVATGFIFIEGPMWKDGKLWFSDVRMDEVRTYDSKTGKVTVILNDSGGMKNAPPTGNFGSNGMITDKDGSILLARMAIGTIEKMDDKGNLKPFLSKYEGKRFNSPNDLVFAPDGALWFTDPSFGLPKMDADPKKELKFNAVWRYAGGKLTPVITDMTQPNGIGFSPDGKTLYVSNSMPEMYIRAYDVGADGKLSNMRKLVSFPGTANDVPDGMKVDSAGDIWATGPGGVRIITPKGKVLGQLIVPETVANVGFAEDGKTVYLTGSTSLYRLTTRVPGEIPMYYRK
jgi:gluconolactonase